MRAYSSALEKRRGVISSIARLSRDATRPFMLTRTSGKLNGAPRVLRGTDLSLRANCFTVQEVDCDLPSESRFRAFARDRHIQEAMI